MSIEVFIEICRADAVLPKYANPGDAGMDVYAAEEVIVGPGETVIVPTGLKLAIPEDYEIQVRPRSGISLKHHSGLQIRPEQ
jgi:dUTP pyrophosphatase